MLDAWPCIFQKEYCSILVSPLTMSGRITATDIYLNTVFYTFLLALPEMVTVTQVYIVCIGPYTSHVFIITVRNSYFLSLKHPEVIKSQ